MAIDFGEYFDSSLPDERYLFHYTSLPTALEFVLENLELKFSTGTSSHDPLERDSIHHTSGSSVSAEQSVVLESLLHGLDYGETVDKVRQNVKYACFCKDADQINSYPWDKGAFRSRMWSQYGTGHKGVCFVFSRDKLLDVVSQYTSGIPGAWHIKGKVNYVNDIFFRNDVGHIEYEETGISPEERIRNFSNVYLLSKLSDYEHESEYRICLFDGKPDQSVLLDISSALEGVILGSDFPRTYRPVVQDFGRRTSVPLAQVFWFRGKPGFEMNI